MVIILCPLLIPHNPNYPTSIGSNMILFKTPSLVVFQILCGFAFCMNQINFALLLELLGGICKMKRLLHLYMSAIVWAAVLPCSVFLGEAHTFAFS